MKILTHLFWWGIPLFIIFGLINFTISGNMIDPNVFINQAMTLLQPAHTIFLAILVESFPFIFIGALLSSLIHSFVKEEQMARWIPKNKFASVLIGSLIGFVLPVCDCGTIPVARSFLQKGVPRPAVVAFLLSAPVVNPVTMLATYFAFGMNIHIMITRVVATYVIACLVGFLIGEMKETVFLSRFSSRLETSAAAETVRRSNRNEAPKGHIRNIIEHTVDELFGIIGFLICSAAVASIYQVYHTRHIGILHVQSGITAVLTMMGIAILFSLCSTADAFVARSFATWYSPGAVLAFMIIGQMADLRNLFLIPKTLGTKVAIKLFALCLSFCFLTGMIL